MPFSRELTEAIQSLVQKDNNIKEIDKSAKAISKKYRENDNDGKRLVTSSGEAIAYALSRMPATYEVVASVMGAVFEKNEFEINSALDVGSGTGAAIWAMYDNYNFQRYTCLEREQEMINIGKELMKSSNISNFVTWKQFDAVIDSIGNQEDLVITSYMINELPKDKIDVVIDKLWNATKKVLVIIEPGTPRGYSNILHIRNYLLNKNGHIIAPCSHEKECKLPQDDWCQFACRIQRNKIHKKLKDGSSPFEDEKYSYIAFSKDIVERASNRILRHPIINKGFSEYKVCMEDGIKDIKLSKKDGNIYKEAKKKSAGDYLNI